MTNEDKEETYEKQPQPKAFKIWNSLSLCYIDAENAKRRLNNDFKENTNNNTQPPPCRGIFRKMTDLFEDAYYAYSTSKELQEIKENPAKERKLFRTSQDKYAEK
ncbi:mutL [Acrasis kona]|uniref:MutL n=1 Tax=Acrasis kona TaxID=1008807 RepID=A0AAW2YHF7_9EUKA